VETRGYHRGQHFNLESSEIALQTALRLFEILKIFMDGFSAERTLKFSQEPFFDAGFVELMQVACLIVFESCYGSLPINFFLLILQKILNCPAVDYLYVIIGSELFIADPTGFQGFLTTLSLILKLIFFKSTLRLIPSTA